MNLHLFFLSLGLILTAGLNLIHFLRKRRETKSEIQIYFMSLFILFIINGIIGIIDSIIEQENRDIAMGISVLFVILVLAAGLSLQNKMVWARILALGLGFISFLYLLGGIIGIFATWEVDEILFTIMTIVCAFSSLIGLIFLFYFYYKTRLSPLFGLFLGILIPTIFFITSEPGMFSGFPAITKASVRSN